MSGGGGTTSTTTSNNAPPAEFLQAYQNVNNQAQNVAASPYQSYQGNLVAPFAPGQIQGMQQVNDLTANGGVQAPYLDAATKSLLNAQTPLWSNVQQFSPDAVNTYKSPYTQQVVDATQNQFNNQNAIQQQQIAGDAISKGAFGGDREAVAQAITAGQEQLAQAPVLAGLRNQGYSQALGEFNNQQAAQLGANEANAWLGSQAGSLFGNLGQEAQTLGLQGANAQMGVGGMQQGMGQSLLNTPYEQFLASQAYPFQTTGWLANIAEGLGGASGGNSSTTAPGPSTASQVAGLGLGAAGIAGQAGAFKGLGSAFSSTPVSDPWSTGGGGAFVDEASTFAGGGMVPARAPGGSIPDVSLSVIPGASGLGMAPTGHAPMTPITGDYGQTSTTTGGGASEGQQAMQGVQTAMQIAAIAAMFMKRGGKIPHREVGGMAASAEVPSWARAAASGMDRHGLLASPVAGRTDQLAISPAAGSYVVPADVVSGLGEGNTLAGANIMQRILDTGPHGLKMPVSSHNHMGPPRAPPAYNENTEHISNTTHYVPNARGGKIQKRAVGGYTSLQDFINRGSSPPSSTPTPTTDVTTNAGMGINASTGTGTSQTGLPALDNYLNNVVKGAAYRQPPIGPAPPTTTGSSNGNSETNAPPFVQAFANGAPNGGFETNSYWNASPYLQQFANDLASNPQANPQYKTFFQDQASNGGGGMASGGMVPRRAEGGEAGEIDLDVDSTPPLVVPPQPGPSIPGGLYAAPAALGMTPALHEQMTQHAIPGNRVGSYVPPPPEYASLVQEAAARHGVDPKPLAWLLSTESHWNPQAYNPSSHTMGMGQFKAATAKEVGIDPWNPAQAIDGSAKYLRQMLDRHGDYEHAIARYGTFSTGHGPDADNAVRGQYRAFMQGAKRGGMVKFADGGMTGDDDSSVASTPLAPKSWLALSAKELANNIASGVSDWMTRPTPAQSRAEAKRVAAINGPDVLPAATSPLSGTISDAASARSPQLAIDPEGGPTTIAMPDKGPPSPPSAPSDDEPPIVANTWASPAVPAHDEAPGDGSFTDPHGLKVNPWEALTTAGFAMAAGRSPHALENIGAGGLAGMKNYQAQRQLAIQDQMRIDQAKTNALWRQGQLGINQQKANTGDVIANARVGSLDALTQYRQAQAAHLPVTEDLRRQALTIQQNLADARQAHLGWLEKHGDATLDQQKAHLDATMDHWNVGDVYKAMSVGKDPLGIKPPPTAEQAAATNAKVHNLANPTATPATPVLLPMPATKDALITGKSYNTGRGPATWDGSQFIPTSP